MRRLPEILQSCWNDGRACRTLQHRAAHRDREICCEPWIVPIPGTTKSKHLEENFGAANVELTRLTTSVRSIAPPRRSRYRGSVIRDTWRRGRGAEEVPFDVKEERT